MISEGLKELSETKFSANPIEQVKLIFNFYSITPFKIPKTLQAPYLSTYIFSINPVGFKFNPPASKVKPFPIKANYSSEFGFPL